MGGADAQSVAIQGAQRQGRGLPGTQERCGSSIQRSGPLGLFNYRQGKCIPLSLSFFLLFLGLMMVL